MTLSARLDRLPLSKPHYLLLLAGGLGYTFDGMDAAVVAFLMPSVRDVFGLDQTQLGLVGSAAPFGFLFGAILAGYLGDKIGRKAVMMWALVIYAVASLVAAMAWNFESFLTCRIIAGAGAGAESAIIAPFLSEFVPKHRRGWFVGALAGFFSFGFVAAALIGRFIVPLDEGWRWAQVITFVPIVMLVWWRRAIPESPRYLASIGHHEAAEQVVAGFEERVERGLGGKRLPPVDPDAPRDDPPATFGFLKAVRFLWSRTMWKVTATTWTIWFVITFSYYGFFTWIPTLLIDRGIDVTTSFTYSLYIYVAQVPGYFSAAWFNERFDRKYTIACYLVGGALSAFWMAQAADPAMVIVAGMLLSFCLNGVYAGVYAYTPEVFPTWLRATGVGMSSSFGRIGSITAPIVIGVFAAQWGFGGVFGLTTVVLFVGVALTLLFAERTAGRSLESITGRHQATVGTNGDLR